MTIQRGTSDRIPPQNLEAEVAVLGAILQESEALLKAIDAVRPDHFYKDAHRRIFEAALTLFARSEPVDLITMTDELRRRGDLEAVGGAAALAALLEAVPTAANVAYHARIVRDKALLRQLIATATGLVGIGYEEAESVDEVLDLAERRIFEISEEKVSRGFVPVKDILKGTFEHIERHRVERGGTYLLAEGAGPGPPGRPQAGAGRRWCCLVHEGGLDEAGVAAFEDFCRRQRPRPSRKIVVARTGLDLNAKLLAKAANMWVWEPEDVHLLGRLYAQAPAADGGA